MTDPSQSEFYVPCGLGLEDVVAAELAALGATSIQPGRGGVRCVGESALGYTLALWLRAGIRVQQRLAHGTVRDEDALYDFVRAIDWDRYLHPDLTLAIDASLNDSFVTHSRFVAQLAKDAIVDRFRDACGRRPSVDLKQPDVLLKLWLHRDRLTLYRDFAGASLHKRGYRQVQTKGPLNEALAAGLLLQTDWDRHAAVLDPMCGSGTFLIEAAMIASDRAPGLTRHFPFERWPDFDRGTWRRLVADARDRADAGRARLPSLVGVDRHAGAIGIARRSAREAGFGREIRFVTADVATHEPDPVPALVVTNPPYGERLGREDDGDLVAAWRGLGDLLRRCPGAEAWVLSGEPRLTRFLRLRADRKLPCRNGPIDCRFLRYRVHSQERG